MVWTNQNDHRNRDCVKLIFEQIFIIKEAIYQMTIVQKQIYLLRLFGYNSLNILHNAEQKKIIERKVNLTKFS